MTGRGRAGPRMSPSPYACRPPIGYPAPGSQPFRPAQSAPDDVPSYSAMVLAGGRSSRMGRDKALLQLDGATLLARTVATLHRLADDVLVVGRESDSSIPARFVPDDFPDAGPLAGLVAGLRHAAHRYVVCVGCDLPALDAEVLHLLLLRAAGRQAAVPHVEEIPQPLHAVYSRSILPIAESRLSSPRRSLRNLLAELDVDWVDASELDRVGAGRRSLLNVNTPGDWRRFTTSRM